MKFISLITASALFLSGCSDEPAKKQIQKEPATNHEFRMMQAIPAGNGVVYLYDAEKGECWIITPEGMRPLKIEGKAPIGMLMMYKHDDQNNDDPQDNYYDRSDDREYTLR